MHAQLSKQLSAPVSVATAEDAKAVQARAAGVAHCIDLLEFDRHHLCHPGGFAVTDETVALHHVGTMGYPAPGAAKTVWIRLVIGVEHGGERARGVGQRRVDVLGLGGAGHHAHRDETRVLAGDCLQPLLDLRHIARCVVGQDDL